MNEFSCRKNWDTAIKHLVRNELLNDILTPEQIALIPSSNISRWKNESDDKYHYCEINQIVKEEIAFIKRFNSSSRIKKINQSYFDLADTFHEVISKVKGVKSLIKQQKEIIVDTIEKVKDSIPINKALKVFNISRSTFENYKSILIYKCESSYFNWCTKRFPNQLLPKEVQTIKTYMQDQDYKFWSKSSVYLKALRDKNLQCGISTFYKYCRLLGFKNKPRRKKSDDYHPVRTSKPNEIWCADVTIFKTVDNVKHYIHFLIDHYSKMILGYRIEKSASAIAIKSLIQNACIEHQPEKLQFLTDGGSENVNATVANFINSPDIPIKHIIAQNDVVFSNSMIEAINKIIKHQFLHHKEINNGNQLIRVMADTISIYNTIRPQMSLGGNTPEETFSGLSIDISKYTHNFKELKQLRLTQNKKNACKVCF
ncbi:transposase [Dokdonia ponticola]|uniref:Transposase n=1 Tax=Dokdonia ponticola TaxID=2041041 RepID=A0ABV9I3N1_9FLAO